MLTRSSSFICEALSADGAKSLDRDALEAVQAHSYLRDSIIPRVAIVGSPEGQTVQVLHVTALPEP
jgi:hypothetical protein